MKITRVRVASQAFFLLLFLFFAFVTQFSYLKGYPVSLFLEADPLVALATTITTHSLYRGLLWSLVLIVPTLLLGRLFCGWICPYGTLHQLIAWLASGKNPKRRLAANRYRPYFSTKYYILAAMAVTAVFGSLQIGWLDPIAMLSRSLTVAVWPAVDAVTGMIFIRPYVFQFSWVVGFILFGLLAMNVLIPRFFCRALCPLGATLGVLSRFSLWRIDRDKEKCTDCDLCRNFCEGASDPHLDLRKSECMVCMSCIEDCPEDALSFSFMPAPEREVREPDLSRRKLIFSSLTGLLFIPFTARSGATTTNFSKKVIRPPGSVAEPQFLERCIKCDQCLRVCPTNTLQPTMLEAGIQGIWTPIMNMRTGYCELNCTLCGQVCPTGAIQKISIAEKLGLGTYTEQGPVRVGTAFYDRGRCLPWAMDTPCVVCEEVCPVSPKAIYTRPKTVTDRYGEQVHLEQPQVDPTRCIGCGICEHECPVEDERAVRVTAVGETRSTERRLLLNG